jgi:hypothetical protein
MTQPWKSILKSHLTGGLIYMCGDAVAAIVTGEFDVVRALGVFAIGAGLYGWEIPRYFRWIESRMATVPEGRRAVFKTGLALVYFNPLWIARHLCLVYWVSGKAAEIGWQLLRIGGMSFLVNIPVSILANYLIQNKVPLRYRFVASAVFSGLMAIYYSMSSAWF